MKQQIDYKTP